MADGPTSRYKTIMAAVTSRKLWIAQAGDCIVTLAPVSKFFRQYVSGVIQLDLRDIDIVEPSDIVAVHAADLVSELNAEAVIASRFSLIPFVLDEKAGALAERCRLTVDMYREQPDPSTYDIVRTLNTKHGFRTIVEDLGMPVAVGGYAPTTSMLVSEVSALLQQCPAVIIKPNRSSNGFGNFVVRFGSNSDIRMQIEAATRNLSIGSGWVFEEFLSFESVPSMELVVCDDRVSRSYSCDQRTHNNAWTGMITPAVKAADLEVLWQSAERLGEYLRQQGYRGVFDLDCGVTADGYVLSEANVRRTGGTYLHELAQRLRPEGSELCWAADARVGTSDIGFEDGVRVAETVNARFGDCDTFAVLTADTLKIDGKWRYLVVGPDADAVRQHESFLCSALGISA
ncbi:hypothetical protein [Nocardia farcinica]|uniref:preATP grasp domain-containing protein n=1 Tax=Nocardia farcinica TaxID=37329 RepID=UPI002453BF54|nr:hypothetical protein [Nocardia farcinica]